MRTVSPRSTTTRRVLTTSPFGFRHRLLGVVLDRPSLIEGAAGAALALQTNARDSVLTRWNTGNLLD